MGTLKLTSALEGVSDQAHAMAAVTTFLASSSGFEHENLAPVGTELSFMPLISQYRTATQYQNFVSRYRRVTQY